MLEEGLINHPVVGFGELGRKVNELRNILRKIEESEVLILFNESFMLTFYNPCV
jgi:hypothetical protein